ncbi:helix-turn-helix domain-containing protein [Halalkalicoccus sp. NIPERK01]|uniref:helix-turn-helix domain-containing protein n=1 Tax=Halalkalicoccus sp. NIPERK01 TaxID=3053469 RepID=UPI00256F6187|nr:helix-turn-helix domain-containing protein [Halalkalicoccus sp. NIPERK01]MDL5363810.1 helix-turn-helix domain-containing protein [Halalkalicoccus sp. NIPERK01]
MRALGGLERLVEGVAELTGVELDNAIHAGENAWLEFLTMTTVSDVDLEARLVEFTGVEVLGAARIHETSSVWYVLLLVEESERFILKTIAMNGAIPHRIHVEEGRLKAIVSVRDWDHLKEFADEIESAYSSFELVGTTQVDGLTYPLETDRLKYTVRGKLTDDQLTTLETSFRMGYYAVPQTATSEDVADRLDISQSTLSTKLRKAQYGLLEILFSDIDDE